MVCGSGDGTGQSGERPEQPVMERVMTMATGELRDDELDGVTGGLVVIAIIAILFGQLLPVVNPPPVNPPKAS